MSNFQPSALLVPLGATLMFGVLFLTHDMLIAMAEKMHAPVGVGQASASDLFSPKVWASVVGSLLLSDCV
jgi:hypothetical protein